MIYQVFCVKDVRTHVFHVPFFARTITEGIRLFAAASRDADSMLSKFPLDFELYGLGTWDDETSEFQEKEAPEPLGFAAAFQEPDPPPAMVKDIREALRSSA